MRSILGCKKLKETKYMTLKDFISDVLCEIKGQFIEIQNNEARTTGIAKSIDCMLEANVDLEQIANVLNKHWNVSYVEAKDRIEFQMQSLAMKSVVSYLHSQGMTETEIRDYIKTKNIFMRISHEPQLKILWKNPKKLYYQLKQ